MFIHRFSLSVGLLVVSLLSVSPAMAEKDSSLAIAVVDMTEVFAAHPKTAEATQSLTEAREASRDDFKEKSNALKEILQRHQELIRSGKKDEAAEELKKANEAEKAIATLRTTGLRDLEESFRKAKVEILTDIQKAVAEWNKDGDYAVILDSSSSSSNGLPQVIHSPGATDVTAEVIDFLQKREKENSVAEKKP
jgi:Skp family chaperone for outer membrane proteins